MLFTAMSTFLLGMYWKRLKVPCDGGCVGVTVFATLGSICVKFHVVVSILYVVTPPDHAMSRCCEASHVKPGARAWMIPLAPVVVGRMSANVFKSHAKNSPLPITTNFLVTGSMAAVRTLSSESDGPRSPRAVHVFATGSNS